MKNSHMLILAAVIAAVCSVLASIGTQRWIIAGIGVPCFGEWVCAVDLPPARGSIRFSLRTLLIATALVAAGLGLIVWATRAG